MMWHFSEGMGWWMAFGGVWMIIFWGALIALTVWVIKKLTERGDSITKHNPLDIAKERYARGDLSRQEFEQLRKDLS